ncbi:type II toxin-antitoxin system VapC family toxin [Cyanobium sp. Morenito 9A2]|uniref:type II toxin-antitoxin system VapC family toxin n=1 Tax=Cyanobium sp. Morenito 9A2 TaxID=2823718 RepID=UPI0020CD1F6D|nr:type II toxin-antitoxin system VapC family toxin [Cyanobium sp. Morenito 9A2]
MSLPRLLLDTHVLFWWLSEPERLSPAVAAALADPASEVLVSAASAWEIATKYRIGRLPSAAVLLEDWGPLLDGQGFRHLAIHPCMRSEPVATPWPIATPLTVCWRPRPSWSNLTLVRVDPALAGFPCRIQC